jgi:hypothetical protein
MALEVWTARLGTRDPDWLDVTRAQKTNETGGGHLGIGLSFAPSLALLKHYLKIRHEDPELARELTDEQWAAYSQSYLIEMRESYIRRRQTWLKLLERPRVVLCCFCTHPVQCHRYIFGGQILPKLGADYRGELA